VNTSSIKFFLKNGDEPLFLGASGVSWKSLIDEKV
jgi:hypothetical protein